MEIVYYPSCTSKTKDTSQSSIYRSINTPTYCKNHSPVDSNLVAVVQHFAVSDLLGMTYIYKSILGAPPIETKIVVLHSSPVVLRGAGGDAKMTVVSLNVAPKMSLAKKEQFALQCS